MSTMCLVAKERKVVAVTTKYDYHVHLWVSAIARAQRRSFAQQVNFILDEWIERFREENPDFDIKRFTDTVDDGEEN
jgi:LPS sulfotransferase NodH